MSSDSYLDTIGLLSAWSSWVLAGLATGALFLFLSAAARFGTLDGDALPFIGIIAIAVAVLIVLGILAHPSQHRHEEQSSGDHPNEWLVTEEVSETGPKRYVTTFSAIGFVVLVLVAVVGVTGTPYTHLDCSPSGDYEGYGRSGGTDPLASPDAMCEQKVAAVHPTIYDIRVGLEQQFGIKDYTSENRFGSGSWAILAMETESGDQLVTTVNSSEEMYHVINLNRDRFPPNEHEANYSVKGPNPRNVTITARETPGVMG